MNALISEAASLQNFLEEHELDFFFMGGIVVGVWGEPRLTQDIDLTVFTDLQNESEFISLFLTSYSPKFSDPEEFALTNRVLPLWTSTGIGINVTLGGLRDISEALKRSTYQQFSETVSLKVCSADDLIIFKTVAARPRDWIDVESVIIRQNTLDWDYIEETLTGLDAYEDMSLRLASLRGLKDRFFLK